MYLKSHSYGEYVFDWGWADAYERAGRPLLPETPVRRAVHPGAGAASAGRARARRPRPRPPDRRDGRADAPAQALFAARQFSRTTRISRRFAEAGFLQRVGQQFHWTNEGYRDFDDYLAALNSRKRKAVKKERREALAGGAIEIELLTGADLTEQVWDAFFRLYLGTTDRKWGSAYLTRRFFSMIGERMPDNIVLVMARRGERLRRRRVQHSRPRHDLRPQLGRAPRIPVPAFRVLLLPGDRIRDCSAG